MTQTTSTTQEVTILRTYYVVTLEAAAEGPGLPLTIDFDLDGPPDKDRAGLEASDMFRAHMGTPTRPFSGSVQVVHVEIVGTESVTAP